MAKRGRPIKWGEAFEKYKSTAQHYTKRAGSVLGEDYIQDVDTFKEQVMGLRDTHGWGVGKAASFLAQRAGLNGASLKQVRMVQFHHLVKTGEELSFEDAAYAFSPNNRETDDVLAMADKLEIETEDELREAVMDGIVSLGEANVILARNFGKSSKYERAEWISQNVFGSD